MDFLSKLITKTYAATSPEVKPIDPSSGVDIAGFIDNITNFLFTFIGGLAVLFIVIGGIRYIISSGNEQQSEAAKKTILYAVVGLLIVILSYVIVRAVISISNAL